MLVEPLETRLFFAVYQGHDTLTITGAGGNDRISLTVVVDRGPKFRVQVNNAAPRDFYLFRFSSIVISGGAGNDFIEVNVGAAQPHIKLFGGPGNDTLVGGAGRDSLFGGPGADVLIGNAGNDHLDGGPGIDLISGGAGQDFFDNPGPDILVDYARTDYDAVSKRPQSQHLTGRLATNVTHPTNETTGFRLRNIPSLGALDLEFTDPALEKKARSLSNQRTHLRGQLVLKTYPTRGPTPTLLVQSLSRA